MNSAKIIKLSEIADVIAGQSPESKFYCNAGTPFLQGNRTFGRLYPTIDTYTTSVTKLAKIDDILVSVRAPVGDLNIAPIDLCIGRGLAAIRPQKVSSEFLYYVLKYNLTSLLKRQSGGTTFSSINRSDIESLDIIIPTNQKDCINAARLLWSIDQIIEFNNKINTELEKTARLIYDYWFTQFDFPDANGKPYKSFGGAMIYNDQIKREIPLGWKVALVRELVELQKGVSYTSSDIASGNGIPMINLGSIDKDRSYRDEKIKYYTGKVPKNKLVKPGDLLIACTDLTSDGLIIGCPIFTPSIYPECTFSMDLAKLDITSNCLLPAYLYHILRTNWYHKYIKRFSSGTNVHHLDVSGVLDYIIEIPPIDIQQRFEKFASPIYINSGKILIENKQLEEFRDWLLPMLMTGQVIVGE